MKKTGYNIIRGIIKSLLHLYFGKIEIHGLENVPKNKPVLFLPNHQNAFLDTILIATACNRSPYFLTRSDVFKSPILRSLFTYCRMIPIYRMRDGIHSLKGNQSTFDICGELLTADEAVVVFPEANHNLERRIRPISKGFTRVLYNALERKPNIDIQLVPVGLNYKNAAEFPDKAAVYYGKPIALQDLCNANDENESIERIKNGVTESLKTLTTHIEPQDYEITLNKLTNLQVNFLNPREVNSLISNLENNQIPPVNIQKVGTWKGMLKMFFTFINFPLLLIWRKMAVKIKEIEFKSTFRFAFSTLFYPLYLVLLFTVFALIFNALYGFIVVCFVFLFNLIYTKS